MVKETASFDRFRLTGISLHHHRTEDENVRSVTRISIPWWYKWKNESLEEETRQKALKI